jgi:hypothetical protein
MKLTNQMANELIAVYASMKWRIVPSRRPIYALSRRYHQKRGANEREPMANSLSIV